MNSTNDEEEQYQRFRQLMLSRKKRHACFISGSCFELPIGYVISNPTDVDKMYWAKDITASHLDVVGHDQRFPNPTFVIDTKNCHVGFARLRKIHSSTEDAGCSYHRKPTTPSIQAGNGASWPKLLDVQSNANVSRNILGCFNQMFNEVDTFKIDYVHAVYCPSWPPEAAEWIIREKKNGWPPKSVVEKIVRFGCHLVAKPHQSNPEDDTQWRFSFSHAEVILIRTWTDIQKYIYHILRLIKSEVINICGAEDTAIMCTYFFKTLMLWACEERPPEFWTDENLETSLGELMCTMVEWLIDRRCPNYFIPSNNMIDHIANDVDLSQEISALLCCKETVLSKLLKQATRSFLDIPLNFGVPSKIMEYTLLTLNNSYIHEAINDTLGTLHSILSDSTNFVAELRHLFNAIQAQRRLTKNGISEFGPDEISSIAKNFDLAKMVHDGNLLAVRVFLRSSSSDLLDDLASFAMTQYGLMSSTTRPATTGNSCEISIDPSEHNGSSSITIPSDASYSHHLPNLQAKDRRNSCCFQQEPRSTSVANESKIGGALSDLFQNLARDWLSPAQLVSSAYCANFYYNALNDSSSAIEQCRMAFTMLDDLESNPPQVHNSMFIKAFSVLLTTEWSALFDENLQLILGFITLLRNVSAESRVRRRKSIAIRICPLEFLKYIQFQSVRKLDGYESVHYECNFRSAAVGLFNGQGDYEHVSRILLLTAIRISGIIPEKIGHSKYSVEWP